jgi:hypothetical protein
MSIVQAGHSAQVSNVAIAETRPVHKVHDQVRPLL